MSGGLTSFLPPKERTVLGPLAPRRQEALRFGAMGRERPVLERAVAQVAKEATAADDLVDLAATSEREDVILAAKRLRLELLDVKAAIERELAPFAPNCRACGLGVHWGDSPSSRRCLGDPFSACSEGRLGADSDVRDQ